jgi:phosphatidylglycerophosphate synthase
MLDPAMRRLVDPVLDRLAETAVRAGIGADAVTVAGIVLGAAAVAAIAAGAYGLGLALILANRLADGLDGAVARRTRATDLGGFLDIVGDFLFYAAVPFGFALAQPEDAVAAAFLILSFVGTGTTFLAFAALAAKRGLATDHRGIKSLYYLGGLAEGTETIIAFALMCAAPDWFAWIAFGFGALCWTTTVGRIWHAVAVLGDAVPPPQPSG